MNFKSKIEAYKLLRKDDSYLILNISDEYNDEKTVNVKETNKHDNLKKKKKNVFEKMKTFINLNKKISVKSNLISLKFNLNSSGGRRNEGSLANGARYPARSKR